MHNSQDGVALTAATTEALLRISCIGCHTGTNAAPVGSGRAPYVFDSSAGGPAYGFTGTSSHDTLAGGNFFWVQDISDADRDRKGHNVIGIADDDALFGTAGSADVPGTNSSLANQLTCAGSTGCHGNGNGSEYESLMPAHHIADVTPLPGTSVPGSYRFISGVKGIEDADWEFSVSPGDHNQYKGSTNYNDDPANTDTITSVCVNCHGYFHGQYTLGPDGASTDGQSPWLRHPTDIDIANAAYDSTIYNNYVTYDPIAPVASSADPLILVNATVQTPGNGIVTCITCHRAHGTPYNAMLRWNYQGWPAAGCIDCDGCQICHTDKD
jgi:cytochrome c553